jgi:HTH-type transcriptional regulator / antitoxin HigA
MRNTKNYEAQMDNIIRLITNETGLAAARAEMGRLLEISNAGNERTVDQDDRLEVLAVLIRLYEDEHWAMPLPDPILAIQYRMDELRLKQSDMMEEFGNKTSASHIMNRLRPLTLPIIRRLSARLGLPIAVLAQEYSLASDAEVGEPAEKKRLSSAG